MWTPSQASKLHYTLNLIVSSAAKYGIREIDVEVVAVGLGAFGGNVRYNVSPEVLQ